MDYRTLCQDFVAQFGLAGGTGPSSVENQVGELGNVVRWVRDAALYIDNLWLDWRYLFTRYSGTLSAPDSVPSLPNDPAGVRARLWETHNLKISPAPPTAPAWSLLTYLDRAQFDQCYDPDTATAGQPEAFTVMPDQTLQFNCPADQSYILKGAFYRAPVPLAANSDVPLIPEEFHRLILVRALVMYADREDAPELVSAALSEYPDLLEKLESGYLEAFQYRRRAASPEDRATERSR